MLMHQYCEIKIYSHFTTNMANIGAKMAKMANIGAKMANIGAKWLNIGAKWLILVGGLNYDAWLKGHLDSKVTWM